MHDCLPIMGVLIGLILQTMGAAGWDVATNYSVETRGRAEFTKAHAGALVILLLGITLFFYSVLFVVEGFTK